MKNSGIDWLGNIPYGWKKIRCKFLARTYTGNSIKDEEKELYTDCENSVPYIATKDISLGNNQINKSDILYIKNEDTNFVRAEKGDILLCVEGGSAGKKKTYLQEEVCFVNKLCCFHSFGINSAFLFYTMQSPHYEAEFFFNMSGLIGGVSRSKLDNFTIPAPTREEQESIVRILNDKVKKIDKLIEVQQAQIEKLKEYKQSVITEAVTKGLDPTAPMKDSGVEWIGQIPDSWQLVNIGNVLKEHKIENRLLDTHALQFKYGTIVPKKETNVTQDVLDILSKYNVVKPNIIMVNGLNLAFDFVTQRVALVKENGVITSTYIALSPQNLVVPQYATYVLKSYDFQKVFHSLGRGLRCMLSYDILRREKMPLPSLDEQKSIVNCLEQKLAEVDKLIALKQSKIEKLQEYKKSLIYEYVTGKKGVM